MFSTTHYSSVLGMFPVACNAHAPDSSIEENQKPEPRTHLEDRPTMVSRIGFIGLGNLGSRLAGRIATAQRAPVAVFDMDRARTAQHARTYRTVNTDCAADAVRDADVVITCLPRSKDVETVVEELIHAPNALKKNTVWIDCTSGEPSASAALAQKLQQAPSCVSWLDCAVSGGPAGAEKGM